MENFFAFPKNDVITARGAICLFINKTIKRSRSEDPTTSFRIRYSEDARPDTMPISQAPDQAVACEICTSVVLTIETRSEGTSSGVEVIPFS